MKKMFFNKNKRQAKEQMELDITSLLDVLVILLVFLLKSYNASDLKLDLVKGLDMALSDTRKLGNHYITLQINRHSEIYMNNKIVGNINRQSTLEKLDHRFKNIKKEKKDIKTINLVFDKDLSYDKVRTIMHASSQHGYEQFKFIVKGNF